MRAGFWSLLGALALTSVARADIYTWVDAQGVRHFSDVAQSRNTARAHLPGLQRAKNGADAVRKPAARAATGAGALDSRMLEIIKPKDGATVANPHGSVRVWLTVGGKPRLRQGEKITYYLDGSPLPDSPTSSTALTLGGVAGGAHRLSAALFYRGHKIRRTAPVTFDMKPPAAITPPDATPAGKTANAVGPFGAPVATRVGGGARP